MAKRRCSYCLNYKGIEDTTHIITKCPRKALDREAYIEKNKIWATEHKEKMKKIGYGLGTIIKFSAVEAAVIENIFYNTLSVESRASSYSAVDILNRSEAYRLWDTYNVSYPGAMTWENIEILSPISPEMVEAGFPKDWSTGIYGIPKHLKNKKDV